MNDFIFSNEIHQPFRVIVAVLLHEEATVSGIRILAVRDGTRSRTRLQRCPLDTACGDLSGTINSMVGSKSLGERLLKSCEKSVFWKLLTEPRLEIDCKSVHLIEHVEIYLKPSIAWLEPAWKRIPSRKTT